MPSAKREYKYEQNRNELNNINKTFKFAMIIGLISTFGVWLFLLFFYLFRSVSLFFEINFIRALMNGLESEFKGTVSVPYFLMFYLFVSGSIILTGTLFRIKNLYIFLRAAVICAVIYSVISAFSGLDSIIFEILLFLHSLFLFWVVDITLRQYKALERLSLEEGFPDFIVIIDEPHAIPNTRGIYYRQYIHIREQNKLKKQKIEAQLNDLGVVFNNTDDLGKCSDPGGSAKAEMEEISVVTDDNVI